MLRSQVVNILMATLPSFLGHSSSYYICGLAEDDTDQCDDGDYRDNDD